MLVLALFESVMVHRMLSSGSKALAGIIDQVMRVALPWFYFQIICWLVLLTQIPEYPIVLASVGLINFWFTWISVSLVIRRNFRETREALTHSHAWNKHVAARSCSR